MYKEQNYKSCWIQREILQLLQTSLSLLLPWKNKYGICHYNQTQNISSTAVSFTENDIEHIIPPARLLTYMYEKHTIKMHVQMNCLMKNTWCSKYVEDAKNVIKTLIWRLHIY
jgi:hypothetical protein